MSRFALQLIVYTCLAHSLVAASREDLLCRLVAEKTIHRVAIITEEITCSAECIQASAALLGEMGPNVIVDYVPLRKISDDSLKDFSAVVIPGGEMFRYRDHIGRTGEEALRKFVAEGGLFVGTCAGAYLGATGDLGIGLLPLKADLHRREIVRPVTLTPDGSQLTSQNDSKVNLYYQNGPRLEAIPDSDPKALEVLGYFSSGKTMKNSIALVRGDFGKGRVYLISPHPELSEGHTEIFQNIVLKGLLEIMDRK